jgi:hypothetical protein
MNAEAKILQAIDAVQDALRQFPDLDADERSDLAHDVHSQLTLAPWSMAMRSNEAMYHGWLGQLHDCLQRLEDVPDGEDAMERIEEGIWAANELERDVRGLVGAR